ncbi:hypothetical protein AeRB84_006362, partial [Aphanomyces euteiches]
TFKGNFALQLVLVCKKHYLSPAEKHRSSKDIVDMESRLRLHFDEVNSEQRHATAADGMPLAENDDLSDSDGGAADVGVLLGESEYEDSE